MSADHVTEAHAHTNAEYEGMAVELVGIKVFAGNLPFATTDEALKAIFAPVVGDAIISASIVKRFGRSAGYGFVTVATQEATENAIATLNKTDVEGRRMIVEVARTNEAKEAARKERQARRKEGGRRGFKAPPGEVTEAEANGMAPRIDDANAVEGGGAEGGVVSAERRRRKRKSSHVSRLVLSSKTDWSIRRHASRQEGRLTWPAPLPIFLLIDTQRKRKARVIAPTDGENGGDTTVHAIVNGENGPLEGETKERPARKPRAPRAPRPRREPGEAPLGEPSKSVLFIANLAFSVDEAALTEFFINAGVNVKTARVVRRRWGTPRKSKGYGFVDVGDEAEQQKAIELTNGQALAQREISVKIAVDAKHTDRAAHKAEGNENPDHPTNGATATFSIVPVQG
ncbi:hypothetical protein FRB96_004485 [Tulasnella sp. 330]|nr:hypothetical protein FRB96_004485 [Tulasnella sp. 330]